MVAEVGVAASGRFMGDPSHEYEHHEMRKNGDEAMEEVTVRIRAVNQNVSWTLNRKLAMYYVLVIFHR